MNAASMQIPYQTYVSKHTKRGWVRTAVEAQRRRGDDDTTTNTRRRPRGDNDRAPSPCSLPHCSPDPRGWVVEARTTTRRPALVVGTGRKGRRVTLSPDGGPLGAVRTGRCFLDWLVVEEVTQLDVGLCTNIAGQAGAVPTARRLQAAARGAGRLRRGAGAPHARVLAGALQRLEGLGRCSDCEGQLAWAAGRPRGCSDCEGLGTEGRLGAA